MEENSIQTLEEEIYDSGSGEGFKRIFRNFSFLTVGKIGGDFFNFVLFVVLTRVYGEEGIGQYSFAMGFTVFFATLSQFGLSDYTIKELSRNKGSFGSYFQRIFSLNIFQSILMLIILLTVIPFLSFDADSKLILAIIGIYQIIVMIIDIHVTVFIAFEQMRAAGIIAILTRFITISITLIIALTGGSIEFALLFMPLMSVLQLFIVRKMVNKRFGRVTVLKSLRILRNTLKETLPFGLSDISSQFYSRIDIVLIGFIMGEIASGIYNVGYRVIFFLLFIPSFASIAIFPIVSRLYKESRFEFTKMYTKALNMMIVIGLPVSVGIWLIAPELIEIVFGPKFSESAAVLRILAGVFILKCLSSIMSVFLISSDHQKDIAFYNWIITIISLVLFPCLILLLKIEGAAIAVLLTSALIVLIFAWKLKSIIGLPRISTGVLQSILGAALFSFIFSVFQVSLFITIPASVLIYTGTLLLFKDIRENELRMALDLIRKK